jgi:hypothetical protein
MHRRDGSDQLRAVLIRDPGEIEFYDDLLTRRHYLESGQCNRNTIVHVIRRGREDVAVLTWEPGVRRFFGMRDELVGWSKQQRDQRLKYCAENRRFLMLVKEPNLASQVLSLSEARLEQDAQKRFGHGFLLAETFVDPSRGYDGACYKAAGWTDVGLTQGGRGARERSKKRYFVKELKKEALSKLKAVELSASDIRNPRQSVLFLEQLDLAGLRKQLDSVPDYRKIQGQYPLTSVLALIIGAVLCGSTNTAQISRWIGELSVELLRSLGCRRAPSNPTIWRVLTQVDHNALQSVLCEWLKAQAKKLHIDKKLKIMSLDGKCLRGTEKMSGCETNLLTLIESISGILHDQVLVGEKTNEIPHAADMLHAADLDAETIVTADAMHTQTKTAEVVLKKTLTTSSQSKGIRETSRKPSSNRLPRRVGRYQRGVRSLLTGE